MFKVFARKMAKDGYKFFKSENGVWMAEHIPKEYIEITTVR